MSETADAVEEVVVDKTATDHAKTVHETVRLMDVEVDKLGKNSAKSC